MTETCGIILHFCKFLMSSSSEDNWILPLASPFSLLQCVVLIEVYAEIQPHTDMQLVRQGIIIAFSDNYTCFPLIPHQNSASASFLEVHCSTESEAASINFLYFVELNSIGWSCTLNGSFTHALISNSIIGHLDITGALVYENL